MPTPTASTQSPRTNGNNSQQRGESLAADADRWVMKKSGASNKSKSAMPSSHQRCSLAARKPKAEDGDLAVPAHCVDVGLRNGDADEDGEQLFSEDDELLELHHHSPTKPKRQPQHAMSSIKRTADNGSRDTFSITTTATGAGASAGASAAPRRHARASASTREKLSILAVIVHLCKGNIGPGAMSLPNGFSQTGIYAAPVMFVIVVRIICLEWCSCDQ